MKVINTNGNIEMSKRCCIPVTVEDVCPKCKTIVSKKLADDYLMYPITNTKETVHLYCGNCNHEWSEEFYFRVTLEKAE